MQNSYDSWFDYFQKQEWGNIQALAFLTTDGIELCEHRGAEQTAALSEVLKPKKNLDFKIDAFGRILIVFHS